MKKIIFYLILVLFVNSQSFSQVNLYNWVNFTNGQTILSLATYKNIVWASTNGGLVKYDNNTNITTFYNKGNSKIPINNLQKITCDTNGLVWGFVKNRCLFSFDGTVYKEYNPSNSLIPSTFVNDICIDKQNKVWLSSYLGLIHFDGINFTLIDNITGGLPSPNIYKIATDSKNNLWITSMDSGLIKFNGINFKCFNSGNSPLAPYSVTYVNCDDTTVWVISNSKVRSYNGVSWAVLDSAAGFNSQYPNSINIDKTKNKVVLLISGAALLAISISLGNYMPIAILMFFWLLAGVGQSFTELPSQILIAENVELHEQGKVYGAHFAWSHLWWAIAYPIAGFTGTQFRNTDFLIGGGMTFCLLLILCIYYFLKRK